LGPKDWGFTYAVGSERLGLHLLSWVRKNGASTTQLGPKNWGFTYAIGSEKAKS
jgi:hypothetical protein